MCAPIAFPGGPWVRRALIILAILAIALALFLIPRGTPAFERGVNAYERGDYAEAARIWRPLAEDGRADAQFQMGNLYRGGLGTERDYAEAARWYRKAARRGNAMAQFDLGHFYQHGWGVAADPARAYKWYRLASVDLPTGRFRHEARRHADALLAQLPPERRRAVREEVRSWSPVGGNE